MGEGGHLKEHRLPPKLMERVFGFLLPPACREEVLGDLFELYTSPGRYLGKALSVLPMVIASRIRRTADFQVLLILGTVFYLCYLVDAWFQDKAMLSVEDALWRLGLPAVTTLVIIALEDAYATPGKRSPWKAMRGIVLGLGAANLVSTRALPPIILLGGSAACLLLGSAVRMLFPALTDRPVGAIGPAAWLKHEAEPSAAAGALKSVAVIVLIALLGEVMGGGAPLMMSLIWLSTFVLLVREWSRRLR